MTKIKNLPFLNIVIKAVIENKIDIHSDIVLKEIDENIKKAIQIEKNKILENNVRIPVRRKY